jgi:ligand-binding sensor domain-containing protein
MIKYIKLFATFLMFVFCASCKGQSKPAPPKDSFKSVRNIKQDRKGNIWFAAWQDIIRYDGKSFTNITGRLGSVGFVSVLEDRKGNFWFGTIGSGVYYYDARLNDGVGQGKSFQNFTTREGLVNDRVGCIYEDKTGNIWFGANGGVSCYDGKSFRNYIINGNSITENRTGKSDPRFTTGERLDNEVHSIIEDKTGRFWFGTRGNVFVYDARLNDEVGQGKTFTAFTHAGKPFTSVLTIIEDKKGNIWLGENDGLWRYDGTTFTNFTENHVSYVYEDKKGNIWTCSPSVNDYRRWTLSRYDEKSLSDKKPVVTEIPSQSVMLLGILEDDKGNIWFGGDGVYRYDGNIVTDLTMQM